MKNRRFARVGVFPCGDVEILVVVASGFTRLGFAVLDFFVGFGELVLQAEVASAGFGTVEGVVAEDFGEVDEVGDASCFFELMV